MVATGYVCGGLLGPHGPVSPQRVLDALGVSVAKPDRPEIAARLGELEQLIHETQKEKM